MLGWITYLLQGQLPLFPEGRLKIIRLATQIGSGLVGVAYILDEPSIGLHQRDNDRLLRALMHLPRPGQYIDRSRA